MLVKLIIGSPPPITDHIIISELLDGYGRQTALQHNRLSLSFLQFGQLGVF